MDNHLTPPPVPLGHRVRGARSAGTYSAGVAAICWAVIVASVAAVIVRDRSVSSVPTRAEAAQDVQLLIASRSVVGMFHRKPAVANSGPAMSAPAIAALEKDAGPRQQLLLVSVIGELEGPRAALDALERCRGHLTDPADRADVATLQTVYSHGPDRISPENRQALISREGWFARLALSFGRADNDPVRAKVLKQAGTAAVAGISMEVLVLVGLVAGLALFVTAIVLRATGRLHLCYGPPATATTVYLESFALFLVGYIGIGLIAPRLARGSMILGELVWLPAIVFAMLWPLLRGLNWPDLRGALGWYAGQGVLREAGAGVVGYVAGLPVIVTCSLLAYALGKRTHTQMTHPMIFGNMHSAWAVIQMYLLAAVMAPLVEETIFRGALFTHLRQRHGWLVSALVTSLLFAAVHPQGWAAIPALGSIGFVLASIREWRGSFVASATAHALNNGVVTSLLVLSLQ